MASRHKDRATEALRRFHAVHACVNKITTASDMPVNRVPDMPPPGGHAAPRAAASPSYHVAARPRRSSSQISDGPAEPPADLRAFELLSRERLVERWGCGSASTFHRAERDGLLVPRRDGPRTGYTWPDIFAFEGGQPPEGMEDDYREDLLTEEGVASLCIYRPDTIIQKAKRGEIPHRRIGRFYRFVRAEVLRWLESWS